MLICWCSFRETFFTALFTASSGYAAQDWAGNVKGIVLLHPAADRFTSTLWGMLAADLLVYGAVYMITPPPWHTPSAMA